MAKWADILLVAPLDANTLAKLASGLCDNLLTCICRAWLQPVHERHRKLLVCPAMNTAMWNHPITKTHLDVLQGWGFQVLPPVEKVLVCGDAGVGAMAEVECIVQAVEQLAAGD